MTTSIRMNDPRTESPASSTTPVGMETMSEAVGRLRVAGFLLDVSVGSDELFMCTECGTSAEPAEVWVAQLVRFEGDSNPDDQAILIAAVLPCGHRGLLSSAYGPVVDRATGEALRTIGTRAAGVPYREPPDGPHRRLQPRGHVDHQRSLF